MKSFNNPIKTNQPTLPDLDDFVELLKDIWQSKWLTNYGKFHNQFEKKLTEYLGVKYISLFANGTLALISALQILRIKGEVITTPYSYVATTHSLYWNNIKPVFVDINKEDCNLNPDKIESAITQKTSAILPVHIYGNPANVERIKEIADKYKLKVIYDAAHSFGVKKKNNSILNFGNLSVLSFHATKAFNTIEGGAIICHDEKTKKRIDCLKNYGFIDEINVSVPGINAKMNELQAAYGILQLRNIDNQIAKRKVIANTYRKLLRSIKGIGFLENIENIRHNYSYFPIFVDEKNYGLSRDDLYEKLKKNNIYGRRYFYPLISKFQVYRKLESAKSENLPIAEQVANEVICLPIYPELNIKTAEEIVEIIKQ